MYILQAKVGCTCQHRDVSGAGRKQSLQRALSPPPPPPIPSGNSIEIKYLFDDETLVNVVHTSVKVSMGF